MDLTPALFFSVFVSAFGSAFQHGYHTGVLNAPQELIEEWLRSMVNITSTAEKEETNKHITFIFSLMVSIYCIGGMVGGMLTKFWLGVFGLKWGIFMNNFLVITSAALMGFSHQQGSYVMFIVGRFLVGMNSGLNAGLIPMYLSEIAPVHLRGGVGSFYQLFLTIAILIAQVVSTRETLGREEKWPYLFAIPVIPSIMQVVLLPLCPDSPRHLMGMKKEEEAKKALEWFRHRHTPDVTKELDVLKAEIDAENKMKAINIGEMFSNPLFRKPLAISCLMMIAQQLSGINAVVFYSTSTFKVARLDSQTAQVGTLLMGAMNVAMTIISTLTVDKAGRKTLLIIGFLLMFIDTILLCVCMRVALDYESVPAAYMSIVFLVMFVVFFAIGAGSIPWFLVNELFLPRARTLAVSFAVPINWLANFIVGISFPILQNLVQSYIFLVFAAVQLLFLIYTIFAIPETKNRNIADIASQFGSLEGTGELPPAEQSPSQ
ncbi:facilitated glucose transporter protein 1-like isoform X2 [Planococcus citri]|uniref:facilitated glucose transporter protein 1-like isoform X2 n=1 Tax=Planococcus citri TaxID=170843 RepID=UPI0031F73E29